MTSPILSSSPMTVQPITTFDQLAFDSAVARAKHNCAGHGRWLSAVEKAATYLVQEWCTWRLDPHTLEFSIPSSSEHTTRYTVSTGSCSCPADRICWHRAARRLVILTDEIAKAQSLPHPSDANAYPDAEEL